VPTEEKVRMVAELEERLRRAESVVLTEFRELTVAQTNRMRRELRPQNLELKVVKNTLLRIAAQRAGVEGLEPYLVGTTAVLFGYEDPVAAPKAANEFTRTLQKELRVKAGLLGRQVLDAQAVKALGDLPGREVLLGQVLGAFSAPLAQLASLLEAPLRQLAYQLQQLAEQRRASA
jgi:large subunit ribosomal protein L10